mgnify:FL=1
MLVLVGLLSACKNQPQGIQREVTNISDSSMVDINHYDVKKSM